MMFTVSTANTTKVEFRKQIKLVVILVFNVNIIKPTYKSILFCKKPAFHLALYPCFSLGGIL